MGQNVRRTGPVTTDSRDLTARALEAFDAGAFVEAEAQARAALLTMPSDRGAHAILAMALTEGGRPAEGEIHYRRALALQTDPLTIANLAWCVAAQGRHADAEALYTEAVAAGGGAFQTWLGWGLVALADGRLVAAAERLDHAAAIDPHRPELALARSNLLQRQGHAQAALDALAGAEPALAEDPGALLARGRLLDELERFDEAFAYFTAGKAKAAERLGHRYDAAAVRAAAERLKQAFAPEKVALMERATQVAGPQPLFILGFPRSGTTLLEQALSNHPMIRAGGELCYLGDVAAAAPQLLGSARPYPEALMALADGRPGAAALRNSYLARATNDGLRKPGVHWFTDKMPLNEIHLGLIGLAFPEAPLVHLVRHPLDVVISAFGRHLTHGAFCAYAIETIAQHYCVAYDLVEAYRGSLALRYHRVRYEDFIGDPSGTLFAILDHIGEPFDSACTRPEANPRIATTPSAEAVREPVHGRAVGRYRAYRQHLGPAIAILEPVIANLGYRID